MEITITGVLCLVVFLYVCYRYLKPGKGGILPPGPKGVPLFGNALGFSKQKFMLEMADIGKEYGDAYTIKIFNEDYVVLNSYDVIKEMLSSPKYADQMSGRPPTFVGTYVMRGDEVFSTYSDEWVALRKLVMRGLKTYGTNLKDVENLVQTELEYLVNRIKRESRRSVDPFVFISGYITNIVSMLLTGIHLKQEDERLKLFARILDSLNYLLSPQTSQLMTSLPFLRHIPLGCGKVYHRLQEYRTRLNINNEKGKRTDDLGRKQCFLDFLLEEKSRGNINEDTVSGVMMNLIMAGKYTYSIHVFYNIWRVLHDENFWDSPWEFNPSRFLDNTGELITPEDERRQRMIAFGVGKRMCLGEVLARLRIFLACAAILQNFDLVPDPSHPLPDTDPRTFDVSGLLSAPQYNIIFRPRESH